MRRLASLLVLTASLASGSIAYGQSVVGQNVDTRAQRGLDASITLDIKDVPLAHALRAIARQADVKITLAEPVIAISKRVTLKVSEMSAATAFRTAINGTGVVMTLTPTGQVMFVRAAASKAQGIVTGRVTDAKTGKGISGATVSVDADSRGVVTGGDGSYRLSSVGTGTHTVIIRLVGYAKQTRVITVGEGATVTADFQLEQSASVLDQVVVTGTVVQTELKAVPNAITVVTAKQIEERGITRIDQLFRGEIPGLFVLNQGSMSPLGDVMMYSRGATALSGASSGTLTPDDNITFSNPIKTYVDGVELADPRYLSQIDPRTIERIEILTGPQASTIYGSNALNGVMQIFTKRGATSRPQLTLNLVSGWVQNSYSSALAPQHDYSAQIAGVEGKLSYNVGSSWNYEGPWTPGKQLVRINGFGGIRMDVPTTAGMVTADVTVRRTGLQNKLRGAAHQEHTKLSESGWYTVAGSKGLSQPTTSTLAGQTLGFTLGYSPMAWWSHELVVGQDASEAEHRITARGYSSRGDTTLSLKQTRTGRRSLRYSTTARISVTSSAQATLTLGADGWQNLTTYLQMFPLTLTGSLTSSSYLITRQPGHNTGGFLQTQLGIKDKLFLTYGLRAEWNPDFGDEVQPNYAPRYGIAYTQEIGSVTTKLRASYGRSTRPPAPGFKNSVNFFMDYGVIDYLADYGNYDTYIANPELGPEHQQGGEGGVEMYFGTKGSLVVTRYNQTVDNLIDSPIVDSVRSFAPNPTAYTDSYDAAGYGYKRQYQNLNIGSIRNQGWELQSSLNTGPFTTKGTYSWTKSRVLGVNPKYRASFPPNIFYQYQPGSTFLYMTEHTWALGVTYARAQTTVGLNINGNGKLRNFIDELYMYRLASAIRLPLANRVRMRTAGYTPINKGYTMADLMATHRFSSRVEGLLQVQNLTDHYTSDWSVQFAAIGRQTKLGARIKL